MKDPCATLDALGAPGVLVVGDVMLDAYTAELYVAYRRRSGSDCRAIKRVIGENVVALIAFVVLKGERFWDMSDDP